MSDAWKDAAASALRVGLTGISSFLASGNPLLAGAALLKSIATELGVANPDNPDPAEMSRQLQANPEAVVRLRELDNQLEATRIQAIRDEAIAEHQAEAAQQAQTNESLRAEISSPFWYVRGARPTFIYLMGISWFYQMTGVCTMGAYAIYKYPDKAPTIITALATLMGALTALWAIALGVVGVYVKQRSNDKARASGESIPGILSLFRRDS